MTVTRAYSTGPMQVADAAPAPVREHRVHWWKEALIVAVFYAVYSWTRNLFGSNKIAADGIPEQAFTNAERVIQWELNIEPVPRADHPVVVPPVHPVHPVLEHLLRHRPLHRHARRVRAAVSPARRRVPPVAQHARGDDRARDHRIRLVPADAPAPARRALPDPGRDRRSGRHPSQLRRRLHPERPAPGREASASSTRSPSSAARGRSTPRRWPRSPTSTRRCRACTSAGRRGARSPCGPCCDATWVKALVLLYPAATLFCIVVTANHFWIDGVGGLIVFAVGSLIGWGLHRWNQDRLDRHHARLLAAAGHAADEAPPHESAHEPTDGPSASSQ